MGWLRLVGSLKLEISTVKEPYKRDYMLQKRPVILRSLHIVATPYQKRPSYTKRQEALPMANGLHKETCKNKPRKET